MRKINLPLTDEVIKSLSAGATVYLSGEIITGRDAAHKRISDAAKEGKPLPVDLKGKTIYYVGPCPSKPGMPIGSCGPTTSYRCDIYTPLMLELGLNGMIGKGFRSPYVVEAMKKKPSVYFSGIGGAGALYADCVKEAKIIAYPDLGAEAIYSLIVEDLPVVVAVDWQGNSIFADSQ